MFKGLPVTYAFGLWKASQMAHEYPKASRFAVMGFSASILSTLIVAASKVLWANWEFANSENLSFYITTTMTLLGVLIGYAALILVMKAIFADR